MPPKKLAPPSLKKGTIGKGPPVNPGGKSGSSAVKEESVSSPSKVPPGPKKLPAHPPVKQPHPGPLSSLRDDTRPPLTAGATTPGGPVPPAAGLPSSRVSPGAVSLAASLPGAAAAHAADEPKTGNDAVKPSPPPPPRPAKSTAVPDSKLPPSSPPSLPVPPKKAAPGDLSSVPPHKKGGAPAPPLQSSATPQLTASAAAAASPASTAPGTSATPAAAAKGKVPPAPPAKKGPPTPVAKKTPSTPGPGPVPPAAEGTAPPPPPKNGLPLSFAKLGAAGKPLPDTVSAAKPVGPQDGPSTDSAGSHKASGVASPATGAAPSTAVRMKTGLVGVGPPPGALLKTTYPGKTKSGASPGIAAADTPLSKKEGPPSGADVLKAGLLQKASPSPLPAATAVTAAIDKPVRPPDTTEGRKERRDSTSRQPHPCSHPDLPVCKVVDQMGKFVGLAHGPPPPLKAQEPSYPLPRTTRPRGNSLSHLDRRLPEEPIPYSSRSTLQRVSRRSAAVGGTVTGGVQYLAPFGVPPGWNMLPGLFYPVPLWPPGGSGQTGSPAYPAKAVRSPRPSSGDTRSRDTRLKSSFGCRPEQSVGTLAAPAVEEQYLYLPYYYQQVASHPFFAYPYYTARFEVDPYYSALYSQQLSQQPQGLPYYSASPYGAAGIGAPLPRSRGDRQRWRSSRQLAEAAAGSVDTESLSSSGVEDDPLRLTSKLRASTSRRRSSSVASGQRHLSTVPYGRTSTSAHRDRQDDEADSISSLEDIIAREEAIHQPSLYSQQRDSQDSYATFGRSDRPTALSPRSQRRTFPRNVTDTSVYGRTPWTRIENKLNWIRGGYGLTGPVPPERLLPKAVRQEQLGRQSRDNKKPMDRLYLPRASVDGSASATTRRRSDVRHSVLGGRPAAYAEEQPEKEELVSGDSYYKHFHTHYRSSDQPWVDEVSHRTGAPRRRAVLDAQATSPSYLRPRRVRDRWSFERGLGAPRRRTYQSLNELAAQFSNIEGEDQDELISLLLLCRRLEKQIEEQHVVIDTLEHELTTASATLKFPPEWRALEGIDLVSLVPADSSFQPSAATPLFLKSTVLLPKQLPDGSSAFTGAPTAFVETAATAPAAGAAAPSVPAGAATVSPAAGGGQPAIQVKPAPPPAAGAAKAPIPAAAGAGGGPKPPPPSVGMKKAVKAPGAMKKPEFKTSIKAK